MCEVEGDYEISTKHEITNCVDSSLSILSNIWNEIGIYGESRKSRKSVVITHVKNLLNEMIREEENLLDKLKKNLVHHKHEIEILVKELHTNLEPINDANKTLLQLERELKSKLEVLINEKNSRMDQWNHLIKKESDLIGELGASKFRKEYIIVPTLQDISLFEEHILKLNKEKNRRREEIKVIRLKIVELLDKLELSPNSQFEEDLVNKDLEIYLTSTNLTSANKYKDELLRLEQENSALANKLWIRLRCVWKLININDEFIHNFTIDNTGYSQRVIQALSDEINRCEEIKLINLPQIIQSARDHLEAIWSQCFVLEYKMKYFSAYKHDELTEDLLPKLEKELNDMQKYYEDYKIPLQLVAKHQNVWHEFLELEMHTDNPERFLNRGCNLLKEEKTRRKITLDLPKIELEVVEGIHAWQSETGMIFTIENQFSYEQFVDKQKQIYNENKENEKLQRQQLKQKLIEDEMLFGSRPLTPTMKRINNPLFKSSTNLNTPSSKRLPDSPQTRKAGESPRLKIKRSDTPMKVAKKLANKASKMLKNQSKPKLPAPFTESSSAKSSSYATVCTAINSLTSVAMTTGNDWVNDVIVLSPARFNEGHQKPSSPDAYSDFVNDLNSKTNSRSTIISRVHYF